MFAYFKMKKSEWRVKAMFYGSIAKIIDENSDIITMVKSLYESCQGLTGDDLRDAILDRVAELVHAQATEKTKEDEEK